MRALGLCILGACATASHAGPADPVQMFADHATLIVRGVAQATTTRDGHIGTIQVSTIYKGACPPAIAFISEPATFPDHDAIFFLHEEGDRWRITLTGPGYPGLSPTEESDVIAAVHVPAPTIEKAYAADLATFRAAAGKPSSPANTAARDAAARIFAHVAWIGASQKLVQDSLGKPTEIDGDRWTYTRHTGEAGVIRVLRFDKDRVVAVGIVLTQ